MLNDKGDHCAALIGKFYEGGSLFFFFLKTSLTSKPHCGFFADDYAINVLGHTNIFASMLALVWIGDYQVSAHQAVVFIRLFQQLNFPVIVPPSAKKS